MRNFLDYNQDNWTDLLPLAEFAYNNTIHTSTNTSPFHATYGFHPHFDNLQLSTSTTTPSSSSERIELIQANLEHASNSPQRKILTHHSPTKNANTTRLFAKEFVAVSSPATRYTLSFIFK
jgi:hypothetical protein